MAKIFGLDDWFELCSVILAIVAGRMLFINWQVSAWLIVAWLYLYVLEAKLEQIRLEKWKKRVFS